MRFLRHSMLGVLLGVIALALLMFAAQMISSAIQDRLATDRSPPQERERVFAVNVVVAEPQTIAPSLEAFGQIESRRTLELRAATGGRIIELSQAFVEGGAVQQGDVLVRIDPADAQALLERAQSDHLDAKAEVRDAQRSLDLAGDELRASEDQSKLRDNAFKRQQDLETRGVGTAAAVETAELAAAQMRQAVLSRRIALAQAEARVDQAATRLARANIALSDAQREVADTTLQARFDGALSEVNVVEGRLVSPNEKIAVLIDPAALEVAFRLSTAQYVRLLDETGALIGAPVVVSLDVSGVEVETSGQITRDAAATASGQSGRLVFARLDEANGFKPGDFVTVAVEEPALDQVVRLPAAALSAAQTVLVLGEEERLEELPVTLLRQQGDYVLVQSPEISGREVVQARTPLLGPGIRVRPLRGKAEIPDSTAMVDLAEDRRAALIAYIESRPQLPKDTKKRILAKLAQPQVPARLVERIESRMGG